MFSRTRTHNHSPKYLIYQIRHLLGTDFIPIPLEGFYNVKPMDIGMLHIAKNIATKKVIQEIEGWETVDDINYDIVCDIGVGDFDLAQDCILYTVQSDCYFKVTNQKPKIHYFSHKLVLPCFILNEWIKYLVESLIVLVFMFFHIFNTNMIWNLHCWIKLHFCLFCNENTIYIWNCA